MKLILSHLAFATLIAFTPQLHALPPAQQAYIKAPNSGQDDSFGYAVAVSGDTMVVGAPWEDGSGAGVDPPSDNAASDAGAAYVYVRSGSTWSLQATLKASDNSAFGSFGSAVAVSGDTVVVGATDQGAQISGAAYVFVRNGVTWSEQAVLLPSNPDYGDWFGSNVAVSGDTVIIGAPHEDSLSFGVNPASNNLATESGAAYVFVRSGAAWSQQAFLKASNTDAGDNFGNSVAVSGDTVVVGAAHEDGSISGINPADDDLLLDSGAAYVFVRSGATWSQQATLKASVAGKSDYFGWSVTISNETVVVGSFLQGSSGAAYVFVRNAATWSEQALLKASNAGYDGFGISVAVSGDTLVVGAYGEEGSGFGVNPVPDDLTALAGAAYVFVRSGVNWTEQAYLKASNTGYEDQFGIFVAVSGDTVIVGAQDEDGGGNGVNPASNESANNAGAAYVFNNLGPLLPEIAASAPGGPLGSVLLDGGSRDLGVVNVGSTSDLTFTLLNLGDADLNLTGMPKVQITGADAAMFSITSQPTSPITGPSGSTTFTVRFTPTSNGAKSAALSIPNNDSDEDPFDVIISGTGQAPEIAVSQAAVDIPTGGSKDFGPVLVGDTSQKTFLIENTGSASLTLSGTPDKVSVSGPDAAMFTVTTQPGSPIGAGLTTNFVVNFAPTSTGLKTAVLTIPNNDADEGSFVINLSCNAPPEIAVEQSSVNIPDGGSKGFGTVSVGSSSDLSFVIKNTGTVDLALTGIPKVAVTGADAAMFTIVTQPTSPVSGPSGSTTFTVRFTPTSTGAKSAALSIPNNDSDENAFDINLTSTAVLPMELTDYLKPSNSGDDDRFGTSVSLSGDTMVIGAPYEDGSGTGIDPPSNEAATDAGAAYVFVRNGSVWSLQATLKASNTTSDDFFGIAVAVSGDTVVVGASAHGAVAAGAAYVFVRNGVTWSQQAFLKASNFDADDNFGISVAVSGDTVVVGADEEDGSSLGVGQASNELASDAGAAYVFVRSGVAWSEQAYLKASNTTRVDHFGVSVAVSGDTVVVGAESEDGSGTGVNQPDDNALGDAGAAYVFVRSGVSWSQQAYLKASVQYPGHFGNAVAVSGDTVVVGSSAYASYAGAAYVFVRSGVAWSEQANLQASNTTNDDHFGTSVAVSGDTVVVGTEWEDGSGSGVNPVSDELARFAGAAYVFVRSGGNWPQQAYLKASNTDTMSSDLLGSSVAVSGDTVIAGAPFENGSGTGVNPPSDELAPSAGAAYVYTGLGPAPEITVEQNAVDIADGGSKNFGNVIVGNTSNLTFTIMNSGMVDLTLTGTPKVAVTGADAALFTVTAQPASPVSGPLGSTTFTVRFAPTSLGAKTAALSIANNDPNENAFDINLTGTGALPIEVEAYVKASNSGDGDEFGTSVALSGDTMVIGAPYEDGSGTGVDPPSNNAATNAGAAYVFVRSGTIWTLQAVLKASNTTSIDYFGYSVAVSGDTVVVGAPYHGAVAAGAAYVFVRNGVTWSEQAFLKASNFDADDEFGLSVAVSGDTVVVGAPAEDGSGFGVNPGVNELAGIAGAAYVFVRSGVTWSEQAYLKASNTASFHEFGGSVAVSGDTVVVGATGEGGNSGATYVFVRNGAVWSHQAYLKASNAGSFDSFGVSVAVSGDTVVVGASGEDGSSFGVNGAENDGSSDTGAAYVFVRSGASWSQQAYLKASNTGIADRFGVSVAVSGDCVVVGAFNEAGSGTGVNPVSDELMFDAGAAYVFVRGGAAWSQQAYLKASNTGIGNHFSKSVALSGDTVIVGAPGEEGSGNGVNPPSNELAPGAGAAYVFTGLGPVAPEIAVEQSAVNIATGGSKGFGSVLLGTTSDLTFTIKNTGTADLTLTGLPMAQVTGTDAALFTVTTQPISPVGLIIGSTTFTVHFAPASAGLKTAVLTIPNNDPDEGSFVINLTGTGESGDIAASFSTLSNPHGLWSYGYTTTLGSTFNIYSDQGVFIGMDYWNTTSVGPQPWVVHNPTAATISFSTAAVEAGALSLHPGPSGQYSVVRYTAPAAGFYRVTGSFFSQDGFGTPKDVHVLRNGVAVFDGAVTGYGPASVVPYDVVVQLAAGETLDFAVGYGSDLNYVFDSTGLSGVITTATGSEITVLGNNVSITDGDTTPSLTDHTDFGELLPASGSVVRTFTITNTGPVNLTLGAVAISGAHASDFTLSTAPTSPIATGNSTTFEITFDPSAVGARSATVSFNNNDADEGVFDFSIQGRGIGPGEVDPSFNSTGNSSVYGTATQPDGKTIVVGPFGVMLGVSRYGIARLNVDGTLDMGFDPNINLGGYVDCVALQPDGKIIIGGDFTSLQPNGSLVSIPRSCIARLNADGTLDTGFDPKVSTGGIILSIVVQPNGKLVIGGYFTTLQPNGAAAPTMRNCIARLNEDGTLDTGFDPNANSTVNSIVQQSDGKLILGGGFNTLQPNGAATPVLHSGIARVNTDGTLDATFDVQTDGHVYGMALQGDGKLTFGGAFSQILPHGAVSYTLRQYIARLNADLTLDTAFDLKLNSPVFSLAAQTDGKVIFGGSFTTVEPNGGAAITRSCIARSNADGTLDLSFNPNANGGVQSIALQADGKIMIGGGFGALQPNGQQTQTLRFGMARLTNDAATQSLTSTSTRIEWLRGGTSPETQRTTFELSVDGGLNYANLGTGTRITGGWELTGLSLPGVGQIRARARSSGGYLTGSSGIVEMTAPLSGPPAPEISVIGNLRLIENNDLNPRTADFTDFGSQLSTGTRTFTIQNTGSATLTLGTVTITGANAADFTVTSAPAATVVTSGYTTMTITFNPSAIGLRHAGVSFSTNDSDEAIFEFGIQGGGPNSPVTDITLNPATLVENNLANAIVGELIATDADAGDAHTFTLIAGTGDTDNASFTILNKALKLIPSADFETKPSYALRVQADDNIGSTFAKELTVTIINRNDVPTFTKGADLSQTKGTITAQNLTNWATAITDNDSAVTQTLTFSTVSITGDSIFSIAPTLTSNGTLSFTPNGLVGTATIGITLTDDNTVNGTPALTSPAQTFTITTLPSPNDLDNDGLLDTWEITHFGSTTAHTATDDTDHDGLVELLEEAFGLDPNFADSNQQPTATLIGGYLTITITKQPGVTYEVQTCGDMSAFSASTTTVLINDAITLQVRDNFLTTAAAERFLRVSVTAAP